MNNIQNVGIVPQYKANFKAEPKAVPQPMTQDEVILQMMNEQKKRIKKEERKKNIGLAAQVALSAAFVTIAATTVYQLMRGRTKAAKTAFKQVGEMPALTDGSVNPKAKEFIERTVKLLKKPSNISEYAGATTPPRMVLFWGPTGTGKTFSAKLLAKEMGAEYGEVQFSELSSAYIGETAVNITNKFKELAALAKKNPDKQYVVAFNEIDSLINNVDKLGSNNLHLGQNRTSFLNGLDSIKDVPNLTIVGTTNVNPNSANLDPATLSRLGSIFEIQKPEVPEIVASLKYHLKKSQAAQDLVKDEAKLNELAESIHAKNGVQRDVETIVNTALSDFAVAIDDTTTKFDADYIAKVIAGKETWAAAIGNPQSVEEEVAQFLKKPGILDYLRRIYGGGSAPAA